MDAGANVLEQIGTHPHIIELLRSLHTQSWFKFGSHDSILVTQKGGRQGCRFGGKLFNLAYAKALKEVVSEIQKDGIAITLKLASGCAPWAALEPEPTDASVPIVEVTFVDDEAILLTARSPAVLDKHLARVLDALCRVFRKYNMHINWNKGKTEALIVYRGKFAKKHKTTLWDDGKGGMSDHRSFPLPPSVKGKRLHIVDQYKHLGSIVAASGSLVPEARHRARSAMSSFTLLAGKVFGSKAVALCRRIGLGWSLIISKLCFNVHVWSTFVGPARSSLNIVYMKLWRRIAGCPRFERTTTSDFDVRVQLGVPSIDCLIRRRRLKYLSRISRCGIPSLQALLQASEPTGKNCLG